MFGGNPRVRQAILLCAFISICSQITSLGALAAPRAAALGPEVITAAPRGGFVGRLEVSPPRGPAGTLVEVRGDGFGADEELDLVWRTVKARWKVAGHEFHGRDFTPIGFRISRRAKRCVRQDLGALRGARGFRFPA